MPIPLLSITSRKPVFKCDGVYDGDLCRGGFDCHVNRRSLNDPNIATMLVDSGAAWQFWNNKLIPGLKESTRDHILLGAPGTIATAGKRYFRVAATSILYGDVVDQADK